MYERDDEFYEIDETEDRRRRHEQEMRRELERLQEEAMIEQERQQEEYERVMELRYYCGREGHRLEARDNGTSCKCGKETVEVFFA